MPQFPYYSSVNSYIAPYSSSTDGGELVTEFNQRAQVNVIGWKTVDISKAGFQVNGEVDEDGEMQQTTLTGTYNSWMSGTRDLESLKLSIIDSNLRIAPGQALVAGYFGDFLQELLIPTAEIISAAEMGSDRPNGFRLHRFVKLHIVTTRSTNNSHDERLVPPLADQYLGIVVMIDSTLPTLDELLLGVITRDLNGRFEVQNNPLKARMIAIDRISGAENYGRLVSIPDDDDHNIYGIKNGETNEDGEVTNLININEWTWLAYNSVLGKFIRNFAANPDDAGKPGGQAESGDINLLGTMVGRATRPEHSSSSTPDNTLIQMFERDWSSEVSGTGSKDIAKPYFNYRVLQQGEKQADCYAVEKVPLPFARYRGWIPRDDIPQLNALGLKDRYSGIVTPETLWQIDQLWVDRESMNTGRQFGPFDTKQAADNWMRANALTIGKGAPSDSGTSTKIKLQLGDYYWVLSDTVSNASNSTGGVLDEKVNYGTVTGQYIATTTGEVTMDVTIPINEDLDATGSGTFSGTVTGREKTSAEGDDTESTDPTSDEKEFEVSGELSSSNMKVEVNDSLRVSDVQGTVTGQGQGTISCTLNDFVQNVSARYVYLPSKDDGSLTLYYNALTAYQQVLAGGNADHIAEAEHILQNTIATQVKFEWVKQGVIRGFACPATPEHYGFLRPGTGAQLGDVINDPDTNQLRLDDLGLQLLQNGGWKYSTATDIRLYATDNQTFADIENTWFLSEKVTIRLLGDGWDSTTIPSIHRLRGNIVLDFSGVVTDGSTPALVLCEDVNLLTLAPGDTNARIDTKDCVLTTHYFNNVHHWQNTVFDSGSNTALVNNPWMTINPAFTHEYENSLQVRFVSVTRGEYEIESAEMDIWIKREDWKEPGSQEDLSMTTLDKLKFPPLLLRLDEAGNVCERQDIPESLNAKVSGTGGTHRSWDDTHSRYVMTGNWVSTIDWEHGEELSVNGRMLSPKGDRLHGLYDVRFRALVQFTHVDDMMESSVDYSTVYQE